MKKRLIVPIVEGEGEELAVPLLIRRWLHHRRLDAHFEVLDPAITTKGAGRLKARYNRERHVGIEHYVEAAKRRAPDAIIVILDADRECLAEPAGPGLGPRLLERATAVARNIPLAVVVANREYEAWFLACLRTLCDSGQFRSRRLPQRFTPEAVGDLKKAMSTFMGRTYEEKVDQPGLTRHLTFSIGARLRSRSYDKFIRSLEGLTGAPRSCVPLPSQHAPPSRGIDRSTP